MYQSIICCRLCYAIIHYKNYKKTDEIRNKWRRPTDKKTRKDWIAICTKRGLLNIYLDLSNRCAFRNMKLDYNLWLRVSFLFIFASFVRFLVKFWFIKSVVFTSINFTISNLPISHIACILKLWKKW